MDPINQYSNNSPAFDLSLSTNVANVNDSTLSESSQNNNISALSKKRLCLEINNEQISNGNDLKKPKLDQGKSASFFDSKNALLKTYPQLQKIQDPFAIETIVVPGPNGQRHCFPIRRRSLENISSVYERKISSDSWNSHIGCIWEKDNKDNEDSYYHLGAANQVVLYIYCQKDISLNHYLPISQILETLESKEERLTVLEDILILSNLYSIKGLQEECEQYIQSQMTSLQALSDYFDICALLDLSADSHLEDLWGKAVLSLSEHQLEDVLVLFDQLICQINTSLLTEKRARIYQVLGKSFCLIAKALFESPSPLDSESKEKITIENIGMFFKIALNLNSFFNNSYLGRDIIRDAEKRCHKNQMTCLESFIVSYLFANSFAEVVFNDNKKIDQSNDLHLIYLGLGCLQENKIEQAFDYFNSALQIRPDRINLIEHCKAVHFFRTKNFSKAVEILDVLQSDSLILTLKGACFFKLGEKDKALDVWNLALEQDCNNASALQLRGEYYLNKAEHAKALDNWNSALNIDPKYVDILISRGRYYRSQKEGNKAIKDFDLAVQLAPERLIVFLERGSFFCQYHKWDKALNDLNAALQINPSHVVTIAARGNLFCDTGKWDKAFAEVSTGLTLDPKNAYALAIRGRYYCHIGEMDKAKADVEMAIELNPGNKHMYRRYLKERKYGSY